MLRSMNLMWQRIHPAAVVGLLLSATPLFSPAGTADIAFLDDQNVLTLPSVRVNESAYAVSLRMRTAGEHLIFELTGVYGLVRSGHPSSSYADNWLTIENVAYRNNVYSASLHLVEGSDPLQFTLEAATEICADCADTDGAADGMYLLSPAFADGDQMGLQYGCSGQSLSPPLTWTPGPAGTISYALIMEDQDVTTTLFNQPWIHWNLFNVPASIHTLTEGSSSSGGGGDLPAGSLLGKNSQNLNYYQGPCPASGTHRYKIKLYALDTDNISPQYALSQAQFESRYGAHILGASDPLTGAYSKASFSFFNLFGQTPPTDGGGQTPPGGDPDPTPDPNPTPGPDPTPDPDPDPIPDPNPTPDPDPTPDQVPGLDGMEITLLNLINDYRQGQGRTALGGRADEQSKAEAHSLYQANQGDMSHDGFYDRAAGKGVCVENVGWNYQTAASMLNGWQNSPGHNTNLLNSSIRYAGVAYYDHYWTFFACQ